MSKLLFTYLMFLRSFDLEWVVNKNAVKEFVP